MRNGTETTLICRLCGAGPCISNAPEGEVCPWAQTDGPKKSHEPDPRPTKQPKKGKKS